MRKLLIINALFLMTSALASAQPAFSVEQDGKPIFLAEQMAQAGITGLSLCVYYQGQPDTTIQLGYRDREGQWPVDANTRFQVGSMSSTLTHFAVLRLVAAGRIDLDTDINTYLKTWKLPDGRLRRSGPVTVRDILLQRRGFRFPYKPEGYLPGEAVPSLRQLLDGAAPARTPRVKVTSNRNASGNQSFAAALILQQLLEDIHQRPFAELMHAEVLQPLGMTQSFFATPEGPVTQPNVAVGYKAGSRLPGDRRIFPEVAHSGLYTTAADYARFVQHVFDAAAGKDNRLLTQALAQEGITPAFNTSGLIFYGGEEYYWGGATPGFYTQFAASPDGSRIIVAFTNADMTWQFNSSVRQQAYAYLKNR